MYVSTLYAKQYTRLRFDWLLCALIHPRFANRATPAHPKKTHSVIYTVRSSLRVCQKVPVWAAGTPLVRDGSYGSFVRSFISFAGIVFVDILYDKDDDDDVISGVSRCARRVTCTI